MKLSISLPDRLAKEIKDLARHSERNVSWLIQRAWKVAREQMQNPVGEDKAAIAAVERLRRLHGSIQGDFPPGTTSIKLAKSAFRKK